MTWQILAFESRARLNFEVAFATGVRAFSAREAILVGLNRDRYAVTKTPKVVLQIWLS
jgi:hypothetical protein